MASMLDTLGAMVTPEMVSQIGGALGVDTGQVSRGLGAAAPTVLASLNRQASAPGGAEALLGSLTKATAGGDANPLGGLLGALGGGGGDLLSGLLGAAHGGSNDMVSSLLGEGANAVSGSLSKSLGFDVKPMLMMAVPVVASMINKALQSGSLDAGSLQRMLQGEVNEFELNPANAETAGIVQSALAAGDQYTALRGTFSDAEWEQVRMAPVAALYLVATASPSGWGGTSKELVAAATAIAEGAATGDEVSILRNAFASGLDAKRFEDLRDQAPSHEQVVAHLSGAAALVNAKAPAEAARFRTMVIDVATRAAEAAKEGGFLGFGGKLVSEEEHRTIEAISAAMA